MILTLNFVLTKDSIKIIKTSSLLLLLFFSFYHHLELFSLLFFNDYFFVAQIKKFVNVNLIELFFCFCLLGKKNRWSKMCYTKKNVCFHFFIILEMKWNLDQSNNDYCPMLNIILLTTILLCLSSSLLSSHDDDGQYNNVDKSCMHTQTKKTH